MSAIEIRPFQRFDRKQLTGLVNAHVAAVIPGITVSVNAVMSQLEREPGEAIVDPWVIQRETLVAVHRDAIVAAAHLHRFADNGDVSDDYRNAASIHWLVAGHGANDAGDALMAACLKLMDSWCVRRQYAGGELPSIATYGVPRSWPHIRELFIRSGFVCRGHTEIILVADVDKLRATNAPPVAGLTCTRTLGSQGTRFSALLEEEIVGMIEVELRSVRDFRSRQFGWADIGNLCTHKEHRRQGTASWLLGIAADWLSLGGIERLLTYAWPEQVDELAFADHPGFRELVRTERGWVRET